MFVGCTDSIAKHLCLRNIHIYIYITTFKYVEGGPDCEAPGGSMKYQLVYLNVVTVCLNEFDSVCLNGRAGQGKPSRR